MKIRNQTRRAKRCWITGTPKLSLLCSGGPYDGQKLALSATGRNYATAFFEVPGWRGRYATGAGQPDLLVWENLK